MASEKRKSLWDEVAGWLTGTADSAIREAEDLTRRGRLKMDMMRLSREIEKAMARLGGRIYRLVDTGETGTGNALTDDREVVRLVAELRELESELKERRAEYEAEKRKKKR